MFYVSLDNFVFYSCVAFQCSAKRLSGKNVSKMTYSVSGWT